jgi:hypothetical protein
VYLKNEETGYWRGRSNNDGRYGSILVSGPLSRGLVLEPVSRAWWFSPGEYRLDIIAGGPWSIKVSQPVCEGGGVVGSPWPTGYSTGLLVFGSKVLEEGTYEILAEHDGSGYFLAGLVSAGGQRIEYLLTESGGPFSGGVRFDVGPGQVLLPGTHVLFVKGEGTWNVELGRVP